MDNVGDPFSETVHTAYWPVCKESRLDILTPGTRYWVTEKSSVYASTDWNMTSRTSNVYTIMYSCAILYICTPLIFCIHWIMQSLPGVLL